MLRCKALSKFNREKIWKKLNQIATRRKIYSIMVQLYFSPCNIFLKFSCLICNDPVMIFPCIVPPDIFFKKIFGNQIWIRNHIKFHKIDFDVSSPQSEYSSFVAWSYMFLYEVESIEREGTRFCYNGLFFNISFLCCCAIIPTLDALF